MDARHTSVGKEFHYLGAATESIFKRNKAKPSEGYFGSGLYCGLPVLPAAQYFGFVAYV